MKKENDVFSLSKGEESITATLITDGVFGLSMASVDKINYNPFGNEHSIMEYCWYVSRVIVKEDQRGKGIGSKLLNMLIDEIKSRPGTGPIIVTPGGYNADAKKQMNFYKKNGFVKVKDNTGMLIYVLKKKTLR